MAIRLKVERARRTALSILCVSSLLVLVSPSLAGVSTVVGGNDVIPRATRDGAYDITFVDMTHTIESACSLTGWNVWAQSYAQNWPYSLAPRSLKLIVLRTNGDNLDVVGKSALETVSEWDRAYHFDLATPIAVEAGDLIGWYFAGSTIPGGVISFGLGSGTTRWSYGGEVSGSTPLSIFSGAANRVYSINVEGDVTPPIPAPGALFLGALGTGLVAWLRRRHTL